MSFDPSALVGRALVPAAVVAVFALLRKYMPARANAAHDDEIVDEDFTIANRVVCGSMILIGVAIALLAYKTLVTANRWVAETDGPAAFRLFPSSAIWWFFPGLAAVCLSWGTTLWLWSTFGDQKRIARFLAWTHQRAGFDSTGALRWMALLIVLPIGIASVLAIPLHSSLRDTNIVVGHYATLARQYLPYSQARRLVLVDGFRDRDGKFTQRAELLLDFKNGELWSSAANADFTPQVDLALFEFVRKKTGLAAEHVQSEEDLRP